MRFELRDELKTQQLNTRTPWIAPRRHSPGVGTKMSPKPIPAAGSIETHAVHRIVEAGHIMGAHQLDQHGQQRNGWNKRRPRGRVAAKCAHGHGQD